MANICDTKLSIQKTENTKDWEEKTEEMQKWLEENYAYDGFYCDGEDEDFFEVSCGTRWNVCVETLQEFAKKYGVRVRAWGEEPAVGFMQVAHIEDTGEIISDEEIAFQF